ncbi:MAG: TonB-dependent receptor [Raineya sp.]|nr:TonB-dependent receptor [Raineya sp.]
MKIRFYLTCMFIMSFGFMKAQNNLLKGKLQDKEKKPITFANVLLYKAQDSALTKAVVTDTLGFYEFENIPANTYYLKISFAGYKTHKSEPFILEANQTLQIPIVELEDEGAIAGVTVVAQKSFVEKKIDRTVINPDVLISNAGVSALDVLEKAPGVQVDENGNIRFKGKAGVMVFIDDKPTYMTTDALNNYLKGLPSSAIETIELMPNPPAKYDAAGNAGVINIKLKKNTQKGFNGGVNLSYRQGFYARTNNSVNFNYRINKFNFFTNATYNINNQYQDLDIERNYLNTNGDLTARFKQNSFIKSQINNQNLRLGMDYYASKKSTIGLVLSGFINDNLVTTTNNASVLNASNQLDSVNRGVSISKPTWLNGGVNLNYSYKIDEKGKELTTNLDYIDYKADISQNLRNDVFAANGGLKSQDELLGNLPATINVRTAKIDYTNPLVKGGNFELGAKTSFVQANNTAEFFNRLSDGAVVPNNQLTNYFNYKENINAAYINFNKEFGKLAFQSGLRVENTNIEGLQYGNPTQQDSSFTRNYTNLFPTIYFNYKLDSLENHQIGLSYGRRINRPNYQDLNPFSYPLDRFTIYAGNPFLVPTFSNVVELSHTYKNRITTTLSYSYVKDVIDETIQFEGAFFFSRPGNIGKQQSVSLSVSGSLQPAKWWITQIYGEGTYNNFSSILYGQTLENSGVFFSGNLVNQFTLGKNWAAELNGVYQSSVYSSQFVTIPVGRVGAAVQRKILKNKGSLKLNFTDVFFTFRPGGDIKALNQATANFKSQLDSRTFILSFSYNFRKGKLLKSRKTGGSEEERNRIKAG